MALAPSTRLGAYEIVSQIGAGGMGEVYRAHDPKLKRDVALKILPAQTASDPERRARFEREAQAIAALNHPNIVTIYSVEDADGVLFLTMEMVEGQPLDHLIVKEGLPLARVVAIAIPLADAVNAAHQKGITHRDLKPANVMVTNDGRAKVLDFGLAKLVEPGPTDVLASELLTKELSGEGRIVGTVAYMSPEQAEGKRIDARSDIFSLGVLLYELATGERPFTGETPASTISSILRDTPRSITDLNRGMPRDLALIVRRCLAKDPEQRTQSAKDLRNQLADLQHTLDSGELLMSAGTAAVPMAISSKVVRRERLAWLLAALASIAIVAGAVWAWNRPVSTMPLVRFDVPTPRSSDLTSFALSPDGVQLVFAAASDGAPKLWVRRLDETTARPLAGTEGAIYGFWSPDGRAIGFFAGAKLKRVDVSGSGPQELADAPGGRGGAWSGEGVILFTPGNALANPDSALMRIPANGGTPTPVTHLRPGEGSHRWPQFLPDGRRFIFLSAYGSPNTRGVYLGSLDGQEPIRLLDSESPALFAPPDTLLIVRQGVLRAIRFDPERGTIAGEGLSVSDAVGTDGGVARSAFSIANTMALAYRSTGGAERRQLVWVDRAGKRLGAIGAPDDNSMASPRLDPSGRRVVFPRFVGNNRDVWMMDVARGSATKLTFDPAGDLTPIWSADGRSVIFESLRSGPPALFETPASGVGEERLVLRDAGLPLSASTDGRFLLYQRQDPKTGSDVWVLPLGSEPKPFPVLQTPFEERAGEFSPDSRWIVYESNESGSFEIYVRSFPAAGGKWAVSTAGGTQPRWRRDGKELYYVAPDTRLMAVSITATADGQTLDASAPVPLFPTRLASGPGFAPGEAQYEVAPDGRFLLNTVVDESSAPPITITLNWTAALKK